MRRKVQIATRMLKTWNYYIVKLSCRMNISALCVEFDHKKHPNYPTFDEVEDDGPLVEVSGLTDVDWWLDQLAVLIIVGLSTQWSRASSPLRQAGNRVEQSSETYWHTSTSNSISLGSSGSIVQWTAMIIKSNASRAAMPPASWFPLQC